ncbi:MAG: LON peptidase substrate-binding domain-containing protein [Roseovarius sp.]|nr:LON peptidase substrate-binding domain-containing protein [Roseovarius sp.]MCY4316337.1 LON peptidase substrate-binding domain-containing protein [Roseovarius sp.]
MKIPSELPDIIPVFPLSGALLLPRSRLPLNIFERRYLVMLDDVLKTEHRLIGMIQPKPAACPGGEGSVYSIGCAGRVTQISETEDGRYLITLTGISRYRFVEEVEGFFPYRRAKVSWKEFNHDMRPPGKDEEFDRSGFMKLLSRFLKAVELQTDWGSLEETEDELLINSLSIILGFDPKDKQALLEAASLCRRRETLTTLMEYFLRGGGDDKTMQ